MEEYPERRKEKGKISKGFFRYKQRGTRTISTQSLTKELRLTQAKTDLIKVSKNFYKRGWVLGTSGNLSILIEEKPLQFLVTASGKDKGELTEEDFLLVDENGKSITQSSMKPSAETLLHSAIYKHTDAKVVFHVHTTNSTLISMKSQNFVSFSELEMLKGIGFKTHETNVLIPIVENSQNMKYLSEMVPSYINEGVPGLILKGHGIYAWGKSIEEAKRHVEIFEFLFDYKIKEQLYKL